MFCSSHQPLSTVKSTRSRLQLCSSPHGCRNRVVCLFAKQLLPLGHLFLEDSSRAVVIASGWVCAVSHLPGGFV